MKVWVIVIAAPDGARLLGARFELERELRIGRDPPCEIRLDTPELHPHHASVKRFGSTQLEIEAAHPSAEVYVDDRATKFSVLQPGATFAVGPLWLKLLVGGSAEAVYHEEIYRMTITDSLTGIHNRRYLEEALEREILRARRYDRPLALAWFQVLGLDAFNLISHFEGDRVLRAVSKSLGSRLPNTFILARISGVRFAIVMPEVEHAIARARAAALVEQVTKAVPGVTLAWNTTALEPNDGNASTLLARVRSG
jgi:diguanylate cyclase (GGDEF)-like protein